MKPTLIRTTFCLFALASAAASGPATAQTRLAEQAMNCSAVLSIFSQAYANEPALGAKFAKAVDIFTEVYLKESAPHTDVQEATKRRTAAVQDFRQTWTTRAPYFIENAVICGAWAEGFLGQGERYQFVPVYPKVVAPHIRSQYQAHADEVLKRWQP
ncbi:hypothetical protein B9Z51_07225 [Limnohabitans sp. T6-5]|uniref:hypothetical protein n=1 Tax=Limnohabitans sp. T6-5 TaxID=1100724 RepID=UPI000D358D0D|nr:hypothetical protein [Limnohabitans sp. T6-5]PUE08730.1 hypothetical protein B9Z51_07225 [Limnohabitans sp. T6-5]